MQSWQLSAPIPTFTPWKNKCLSIPIASTRLLSIRSQFIIFLTIRIQDTTSSLRKVNNSRLALLSLSRISLIKLCLIRKISRSLTICCREKLTLLNYLPYQKQILGWILISIWRRRCRWVRKRQLKWVLFIRKGKKRPNFKLLILLGDKLTHSILMSSSNRYHPLTSQFLLILQTMGRVSSWSIWTSRQRSSMRLMSEKLAFLTWRKVKVCTIKWFLKTVKMMKRPKFTSSHQILKILFSLKLNVKRH